MRVKKDALESHEIERILPLPLHLDPIRRRRIPTQIARVEGAPDEEDRRRRDGEGDKEEEEQAALGLRHLGRARFRGGAIWDLAL